MPQKPYLEKIDQIANIVVWLVDGKYIREHLNREFTNFGHHYRFPFIPKYEFWIDRERVPGEEKYFIENMLIEYRLISEGKSQEEAAQKAERVEKRERNKSRLIKETVGKKVTRPEIIQKIHQKLLKEYGNGRLKVWVVNGELVRGLYFIDFTEGGHDLVYPFIPDGEIWIDNDVQPEEIKYILLHELRERNLMAQGWSYDLSDDLELITKINQKAEIKKSAHRSATEVEFYCRRHPQEVDQKIAAELKLAN